MPAAVNISALHGTRPMDIKNNPSLKPIFFILTQKASGKAGITFAALSFAVGPLIGRYCGINMPSDIRSTTGVLSLTFHTDLAVAKDGFSAQYYLIHQEVPDSKLEMRVYDLVVSPVFPIFHLAHVRVKQAEVCPGTGSPPAVQTEVSLRSVLCFDRVRFQVRIQLSDLFLTFHLLVKSSQYLLG